MEENNNINKIPESTNIIIPEENSIISANKEKLNSESLELINQIIEENDIEKAKDLTFLFNVNQNKKNIVRVNKLNNLLDKITDQAVERFTKKPGEISNKELFDGLKIVSDLIEKGQSRVLDQEDAPLIQINQLDNSVNVKDGEQLGRDSREKVKNAVMSLLGNLDLDTLKQVNKTMTETEVEVEDKK